MNIILSFGLLAFLSTFCASVQGRVWTLAAAEVESASYLHGVSIERNDDDGKTWYIHAIPEYSIAPVPVHGPFQLRGFGPYAMLTIKIWLNTNGDNEYVTVTFPSVAAAREFYRVLNPYHSASFLNDFKVDQLVIYSSEGNSAYYTFQTNVTKAFDSFLLETSTGTDSRVRRYVVHDVEGDQEPILVFNSLETEMAVEGDYVMVSIRPQSSPTNYRYGLKLKSSSAAQHIMHAHTLLNTLGSGNSVRDIVALPRNTYYP